MKKNIFQVLGLSVVLIALIILAQFNYLLFHSLVEFFSIIVGGGIFMFAWNTRKYTENDFFLFLGIAFLFIISIDYMHILTYRGMGVFPGEGANLPTQLWIIARYLESLTFLVAPLFLSKRLNYKITFIAFSLLSGLIIVTLMNGSFPTCFVEGSGLTPFKKWSEYLISTILALAFIAIVQQKSKLNPSTYTLILAAILCTILSELSFTFYISVYGTSNLIGHLFKIVAFYLIYNAVVVSGLKSPYQQLESRENELQRALNEIKTIRGILPICMHCKKIRASGGDWEILEKYISEHSYAEFSHGICENCMKQHYPEESTS